MRILIAEDEQPLARAIVKIFEKNKCSADAVSNGQEALTYLESGNYDVLVLDIMMPVMDGLTALRKLRQQGNRIPVLILSAKAEVKDKVQGLDSGANYYLSKPFAAQELLAAVRAITRSANQTDALQRLGNVTLDSATFTLSTSTGSFRLANKEFQMMQMLLRNPGHLISTERFMERIWGYDSDTEMSVVWVYISYLRKKLTSLQANVQIKVSRNAGYCLEELP